MSALSSPACGRASGRFSTLMARAGRFGGWAHCTPVSGHVGGAESCPVILLPMSCSALGPVPVSASTETRATSPTTAPPAPAAIFPRLVKATLEILLTGGLVTPEGPSPAMVPTEWGDHKHPGGIGMDSSQKVYISSRILIRSWIGGGVENILPRNDICSPWTRDGWSSHRWAAALFAERMAWSLAAPFRSAAATPGGYRVSMAPSASARYSRRLDTANLMICATIGARISRTR